MTELVVQKAIRIRKAPHNKKRSGRMSVAGKIRKERLRLEAKRKYIDDELKKLQDQICKHPNLKLVFDAVEKVYAGDCPDCNKHLKTDEEPKEEQ